MTKPAIKKVLKPAHLRRRTRSGFDLDLYEKMKRDADEYRRANGRPLSKTEKRIYFITGKLPP